MSYHEKCGICIVHLLRFTHSPHGHIFFVQGLENGCMLEIVKFFGFFFFAFLYNMAKVGLYILVWRLLLGGYIVTVGGLEGRVLL